ncbi:MAG: D-alanyl-D-alanine carboxypeptidase family protein [Armatimonadota bacterium]|nr:D-alanyl-D-alanine carboxypeptidase family protein [Armatimonadota bacterium]
MKNLRPNEKKIPRAFAALAVFAALLLGAASILGARAAEDGVIVLRLEDGDSLPRHDGGRASDSSSRDGRSSTENRLLIPRVVDVKPSLAYPAPQPNVKAASFALMDADTGQLIYSRNPHVRRPNASTTKVMTAILLIEKCGMNEKIRASKKASETPYTSIHLKPGEEITAKDLLMAMMVRSANDAAVAAAEHIAGSTAKFAALMNKKAREIGCWNTHFVTPNGLYAKNHYSTAYDLCLMLRYALRYPVFREAINTRKYVLDSRTINRKDLVVFSRCKFLRDYPWADGAKTGYIKQAGYCLVGTAVRDGWRLVCAVLKSDNAGRDMAAILDYGFTNFQPYTIATSSTPCAHAPVRGGSSAEVPVVPVRDVRVVVPKTGARIATALKPVKLEAPVKAGTKAGTLTVFVNGKPAVNVELQCARDVGLSWARRAWLWAKTGTLVFGVVALGAYGTAFAKNTRSRRRRFSTSLRRVNRFR